MSKSQGGIEMSGMLLVDMSNLVFSTVLEYHHRTKEELDMSLVRYLVIDRLMFFKKKLSSYNEIVLCFDGRRYWRREVFPHYKGRRGESREKDSFDWEKFFEFYDRLKTELKENFPVKYIELEGAEADDSIAVLCKVFGPHKDICILSSDKDFIQIQQHVCSKVKQWSLHHGKFLTPRNTEYDILEHIVKGDSIDGIPNILSEGDTFMVEGKRQKPVRKTFLEECLKHGAAQPEKFCKTFDVLENFKRNEQLIDFRFIPEELAQKIVDEYNSAEVPKGRVFNYFVQHRLTRLMANGSF